MRTYLTYYSHCCSGISGPFTSLVVSR